VRNTTRRAIRATMRGELEAAEARWRAEAEAEQTARELAFAERRDEALRRTRERREAKIHLLNFWLDVAGITAAAYALLEPAGRRR
jgi:hypothetical protein